jgi:hypothetical protein
MKKLILLIIAGCLLAAGGGTALADEPVAGVLPGNAFIPKGTILDVETASNVHSGDLAVGDIVYFKLQRALSVDGIVVVPAGAAGEAVVTDIRQANFFGRGGGITLTAKSLRTTNGAEIPLTMDIKRYGGDNNFIFASILLASKYRPAGALFRGSDQVIPLGTRFQVAVAANADLGCTPAMLPIVMAKNTGP